MLPRMAHGVGLWARSRPMAGQRRRPESSSLLPALRPPFQRTRRLISHFQDLRRAHHRWILLYTHVPLRRMGCSSQCVLGSRCILSQLVCYTLYCMRHVVAHAHCLHARTNGPTGGETDRLAEGWCGCVRLNVLRVILFCVRLYRSFCVSPLLRLISSPLFYVCFVLVLFAAGSPAFCITVSHLPVSLQAAWHLT
jgi:hypothetical protein